MRILVVGGSGMLGSDLVPVLQNRGHEVIAPSSKDLDITDPASVAALATGAMGQFDWCVNCAAYTAVDKAESEVREATELNAFAPGFLARACLSIGCKLIHISTDFVFDGSATSPYDEDAPTNPLGVYGRTKRDGEEAVLEAHHNALVVRTSWLYGPNGNSFPRTMIRAQGAGKKLRVVSDQIGCPTYTTDLAQTLCQIIKSNVPPGIYHAAGPDRLTWHAFAKLVLSGWTGEAVEVEAISTAEWPTPAKRPAYSVLGTTRLEGFGIPPMRSCQEAVSDFCRRLRQNA